MEGYTRDPCFLYKCSRKPSLYDVGRVTGRDGSRTRRHGYSWRRPVDGPPQIDSGDG